MNKLDVFDDGHNIDMSEIQMELVASSLVSLLKHNGSSRAQLAGKLDCKRNRVTRILSGDENLTLKTITSVAEALGYAFDVVFYNKDYPKPKQPWTIDKENRKITISENINISKPKIIKFELQTGDQVANDVIAGTEAEQYIRITEFSEKFTNYSIEDNGVGMLPILSKSSNIYTYDLANEAMDYEY